jgi:tetratricopeptide (TPR) repeat protein
MHPTGHHSLSRLLALSLLLTAALPAASITGASGTEAAGNAAREGARLNNLGTAFMNQQLLERAADTFAQAYQADPTLALAKINQGLALIYLQKFPEAQKALDIAAAKAPADPHTWYALGLLYRNQSQPKPALDAFNKVLALDPADADTHYLAASIDLELNDLPAALAEYRKALALNPLHASAEFGLARALQRQGQAAAAHDAFAQFQHITSSHLGAPLAHTYGDEGRYARVEDASPAITAVAPMIPVTYTETWRSPASAAASPASAAASPASAAASHAQAAASQATGAACLIELPSATAPTQTDLDLVLMGSGPQAVRLYRNTGRGFDEIPQTGLQLPGRGLACAVGDFDNDGLPDLALAVALPSGEQKVLLYRNSGNSKFEDVTPASGITPANRPTSLTWVDFDHDGDLDLFVTGSPTNDSTPNALWRNNGNKTFTNWTKESGMGGERTTTSAILSDLNNDRAVDRIVTGGAAAQSTGDAAGAAPTFFANRREGPFAATPLYPDPLPPTTSVATLDFNKDGWMDVLVTHSGAPGVTLWRNRDGRSFERVPLPLPAGIKSATAAIPIDFDNDGWIDLALLLDTAAGPQLRILRNLGPAGFADVSAQLHLDALHLDSPKSLLAADLSGTGAPDLLLTQTNGTALLLQNQGGNRNHSLRMTLQGMADNKSGIGTKVEVFGNGLWQKWEVSTQPEILAGLGAADQADLIRLLWPSGVPQDEIDQKADGSQKPDSSQKPGISLAANGSSQPSPLSQLRRIVELDRRGSSCPTLFAWDGAKYSFIADVIGAAVVGHWTSPTQHNIPDPDEWIKIDGRQLRAHHGSYSLRFGEPMEEVNFVDQVRLVAIDHPADAAVYPNEGFLSAPPFAQPKTIVASSAHPLAGAWDDHGKDVLPLLSQRSGASPKWGVSQTSGASPKWGVSQTSGAPSSTQKPGAPSSTHGLIVRQGGVFAPAGANRTSTSAAPLYIKDFTNLPFAGFANLHTLTLDLGPWSPQQPLRLLLHGFIEYFSASSMYSAWQAGLAPIPPYIEAQLPNGTWQKVVDDMGFPAGLPRTVVVDLTGKLPPGAARIRITTNLQIYWDHAEVDDQPSTSAPSAELHQTELPLTRASLAFRGYPQQLDGLTPGDLTYNYQQISATGPFLPHRGAYTRYGDVTPLLHAIDDQFVIFGTGEDMDLEFASSALPPLPAGWSRDFFFYANGFVKDMDFYEASPFSVGQLPFHGMSTYPYPASEHYPDDPAHTAYQLEYNTRFQSGSPGPDLRFHYAPHPSVPDPAPAPAR